MGKDGKRRRAAHGLVWVGESGHGVTILAYPRLMRNPVPALTHPHHTYQT